jgi:hypothetical protein
MAPPIARHRFIAVMTKALSELQYIDALRRPFNFLRADEVDKREREAVGVDHEHPPPI